jgi:hypothetical protein
MIEDHDPVIEIREVTDPEEVWDKQHSPINREPEYLDNCTQERCPEGDDAYESGEDRMNAKECKCPGKGKQ